MTANEETRNIDGFHSAILLQGLAAFLELCSEPFYILSTVRLWFGIRVGTEAAATLAKNILTLLLLMYGSGTSTSNLAVSPALAFSWGQVAYGSVTLLVFSTYFAFFASSEKKKTSGKQKDKYIIDRSILSICGTFSLQAAGKLLLAEGSKAVLATATALQEQGVYGLVNNLGSLVVRTVFQPYEEVAFVAFSRNDSSSNGSSKGGGEKDEDAAKMVKMTKEKGVLLGALTQGIALLGLVAAAFGPAYSYIVVLILYGRTWADSGAPQTLALYSSYIALLAINGTLEAFVHATADQRQLRQTNAVLVALSLCHMGVSVGGVKIAGGMGLLVADGVNMGLRIGYCMWFISRGGHLVVEDGGGDGGNTMPKIVRLLPQRQTLMALGGACVVTLVSQAVFMPVETHSASLLLPLPLSLWSRHGLVGGALLHLGVGVLCLIAVGVVAMKNESQVVGQWKKNKSKIRGGGGGGVTDAAAKKAK